MLGHSLVRTNGPFLEADGIDMLLLTNPDITFGPASLRALGTVGWQLRQASRTPASHSDHLWFWGFRVKILNPRTACGKCDGGGASAAPGISGPFMTDVVH